MALALCRQIIKQIVMQKPILSLLFFLLLHTITKAQALQSSAPSCVQTQYIENDVLSVASYITMFYIEESNHKLIRQIDPQNGKLTPKLPTVDKTATSKSASFDDFTVVIYYDEDSFKKALESENISQDEKN